MAIINMVNQGPSEPKTCYTHRACVSACQDYRLAH